MVSVLSQIATHPGTWDFLFKGRYQTMHLEIVITNGKLTIGGQTISPVVSDNIYKPTSSGWVQFKHGVYVFYIRFTTKTIEALASMADQLVPGTLTKEVIVHQTIPPKR